jgi:alpha-D-ribose 1-methylphosphonate 5-triphosphate synthase subunit PhnL
MIELQDVSKTFTLHNQGAAVIEVLRGVSLSVRPGECVALTGSSGAGKSTLMRMIYGNYMAQGGAIHVGGVDLVQAEPRQIIRIRREVLGYVSQFLRVVPRVPTLEVVAEPLRTVGVDAATAEARARALLARLNIPEALWRLSPTTFSGGEQQRVNIARGFAHPYPALLLDEPTASLDATNRAGLRPRNRRGGVFARRRRRMTPGRLIAVVGPSGVGKDSLMAGIVAAAPQIRPVRGAITRAPDLGGEDYDALSPEAFAKAEANGAYCLSWGAHGLFYGIPVQLHEDLRAGTDCLVNLSRNALPQAARLFPRMVVLHVTASPEVLARRLAQRGRESGGDIARRLAQADKPLPEGLNVIEIRNDGALGPSVQAALGALRTPQAAP